MAISKKKKIHIINNNIIIDNSNNLVRCFHSQKTQNHSIFCLSEHNLVDFCVLCAYKHKVLNLPCMALAYW